MENELPHCKAREKLTRIALIESLKGALNIAEGCDIEAERTCSEAINYALSDHAEYFDGLIAKNCPSEIEDKNEDSFFNCYNCGVTHSLVSDAFYSQDLDKL